MKTVSAAFGAVALFFASSVAVKADDLLAGPLPVPVDPFHTILTCSATNINPDNFSGAHERVTILIEDASDNVIVDHKTCPNLRPTASCSLKVKGVHPEFSPLVCNISSCALGIGDCSPNDGPNGLRVRGSFCGTLSDSTYCLQALPFNVPIVVEQHPY
jgi:hypothetical protein